MTSAGGSHKERGGGGGCSLAPSVPAASDTAPRIPAGSLPGALPHKSLMAGLYRSCTSEENWALKYRSKAAGLGHGVLAVLWVSL